MSKEKSDEPHACEDVVAPGRQVALSGRPVGSRARGDARGLSRLSLPVQQRGSEPFLRVTVHDSADSGFWSSFLKAAFIFKVSRNFDHRANLKSSKLRKVGRT